jgi:hypothetical protein
MAEIKIKIVQKSLQAVLMHGFMLSKQFVARIVSVLGQLHRVDVSSAADVSEVHAASYVKNEVRNVIESSCSNRIKGGGWYLVSSLLSSGKS